MKKKYGLITGAIMIIVVLAVLSFGLPRDNTNDVVNNDTSPTVGSTNISQQSVKVHGYWTIEVREFDGSLVSRHEFENELPGWGSRYFARMLAREAATGLWTISLNSINSGIQLFQDSTGNRVPGYIVGSIDTSEAPNYFKNLTAEVPTSGSDTDKLVLNGRAIAAFDGSLIWVYTYISILAQKVDPDEVEYGYQSFAISQSDLRESIGEIDVLAGQQIMVKIAISFS